MCILFVHVSANPGADKYKLILASNRDEYFGRPTKVANFWTENPDIIGGRDLEPGKAGGTWLALSKTGKIGVLLNILTDDPAGEPGKLGRGFLVNDYLNGNLDGFEYCNNLYKNANLYNPFNLVTIDLKKKNGPYVTYYSSKSLDGSPVQLNCDNTYAFGNSVLESPFMKVQNGHEKMIETVMAYNSTEKKQQLLDQLLGILKCKKQFSDPQMKLQAPKLPPNDLQSMSSAFVEIPAAKYGSRTHTVILVDNQDQVEFHEWTMGEANEPAWIHSVYKFALHC